jgi:hypothetical protein
MVLANVWDYAETLAIIVSLMQKEMAAMQTPGLGEAETKATHRNIEVSWRTHMHASKQHSAAHTVHTNPNPDSRPCCLEW